MRNAALGTALLLSALLAQSQALAEATIAVAHPADDDGWALGVSYDADSRAEADSHALDECRTRRDANRLDAECLIVSRFDNQCMALAKDTGDEGTAWGWAVAPAQVDADSGAMANCRSFAGARAGYCEVTMRHCDGGSGAK